MSVQVKQVSASFAVCPQLGPDDMSWVASQGFRTVINNRPDGEGGAVQPDSEEMQRAALSQGLHYVYLPVVSGAITQEQAAAMAQALKSAPGPVLAFCRSGARSTQLFSMAQAFT
ncbi:TIGR01244 family sulfur transferase [Lacisediminimonas profundi]|uniref:TIGR01244 family sulfur transferase n=1 Tax=Lacisediminimonas profundi TaxID=2603856 RepID=UPI00124BB81A|nr:TIGR01244 family sulfur transferase [Lacisediminimonas profundi]